MELTRRVFLQAAGAAGMTLSGGDLNLTASAAPAQGARHYRFVQMDVFTSLRLQGNPLAVFPDARGLSDEQMQGLARETNLQETTFVLPRDPAVERQEGVKVRIFVPNEEIPFGGHPTLGTAMLLRNLRSKENQSRSAGSESVSEITLDLKVGKVPVRFTQGLDGNIFGEMRQVDPKFGPVYDRESIAAALDLRPGDISEYPPIQSVSTGLPFILVPVKGLSTLQRLTAAPRKAYDFLRSHGLPNIADYYYVTRDTGDAAVGARARAIYPEGEDPATGSAAGCTAAWMVQYGLMRSDEKIHIVQGVEVKRTSHIFAQAGKVGDTVTNVRVGGNAMQIMEGTYSL